ncbi:MAG: glycosyltransferase family 39 protein, partial [Chloroflexi bacterium]|nr:glycosyltransferase family 39 protein [Chloroflexota bacterium]
MFLALPWRSVLAARADVAALLAILAVFSFVCFQQLTEPGLYEDEAWSATPAVRMVMGRSQIDVGAYHQFTAFGHVLPYMRNGYVGPVKTLLVAATFSAFGISVFVLRATTSLVGLATVLILYVFVRREFGRAAALAAALLLATDLSYVLAVRDDWGPVALGMLARVLSLALLFAWYRARTRTALLCAAMFTLGIGVTHKVDLAAFVLSILAAGALVFGRQLRVRWPEAIAALASFAAGVWPVVLYNVLTQGGTLQEGERLAQGSLATRDPLSPEGLWLVVQALPSAFSQRVSLLDGLLSGTGIADWLSGAQLEHASPLGPSPLPAVSVVAGLVLLALLLTGRLGDRARPVAFLLATFAFTFLFIVIAPIASGQHHVLGVYPLSHLMVGICIGILWQRQREMPRWRGWST